MTDGPLLVLLHGLQPARLYADVEALLLDCWPGRLAGPRPARPRPLELATDPGVRGVVAFGVTALVDTPVLLPGLGHNPHVEDPSAITARVRRFAPA